MKLINSSVEIIPQEAGLQGIYKQIEKCGRICYKSEDKITENSSEEFVKRMINSKHTAMLEHGTVYLKIPKGTYSYGYYVVVCEPDDGFFSSSYELDYRPYTKVNIQNDYIYVTTNYRVLIENNRALRDLQYLCEPTEYHEKRYTVKFITDRGVSHELVRHRKMSFSQESSRYCNYSKDKFNNELTFIIPSWCNVEEGDYGKRGFSKVKNRGHSNGTFSNFVESLRIAEYYYLYLIKDLWTPQQARQVLPNALKTEICVTGFEEDWKNFFDLRYFGSTGKPHPDMQKLASELFSKMQPLINYK